MSTYSPDFFEKLSELVEKARKPTNQRANSALSHLKMAKQIKSIDPSMAAFRLITGEEEASSAIMLALKSRKYAGANKLLHKDHVQKLAVYPFLKAIGPAFGKVLSDNYSVGVSIESFENKEIVRVRVTKMENGVAEKHLYPIPPLNFVLSQGENQVPYNFENEFKEFAAQNNVDTIKKHIEKQFEIRNSLLYASDLGLAHVNLTDKLFDLREKRIVTMVLIYLMIDPYFEKQLFVQKCLDIFLNVMEILPKELRNQV